MAPFVDPTDLGVSSGCSPIDGLQATEDQRVFCAIGYAIMCKANAMGVSSSELRAYLRNVPKDEKKIQTLARWLFEDVRDSRFGRRKSTESRQTIAPAP